MKQKIMVFWAVFGVSLLLFQALFRLTPVAIEPWRDGSLSFFQKGVFIFWVIFNGYMEGYRAFQKRFCPRVISRAFTLAQSPSSNIVHFFLAPFYALGFINNNKKQLLTTWIFFTALIGLIVVVRHLDQPWRGIIDGGVVVGLGWGLVYLWVLFFRTWMGLSNFKNPNLNAPAKT